MTVSRACLRPARFISLALNTVQAGYWDMALLIERRVCGCNITPCVYSSCAEWMTWSVVVQCSGKWHRGLSLFMVPHYVLSLTSHGHCQVLGACFGVDWLCNGGRKLSMFLNVNSGMAQPTHWKIELAYHRSDCPPSHCQSFTFEPSELLSWV